MKTNVYIDGFNFYYGMFREPRWLPWKWLDFLQLSQRLAPGSTINRIRYFTAEVEPTPHDRDKAVRQQTYFRALETIPVLTIHRGTFLTKPQRLRVVHPIPLPTIAPPIDPGAEVEVRRVLDSISRITVNRTEEKGSDVNLASYLLMDAFRNDCEAAIVISNDSDLATPITLVREECGLDVTVFNPHKGNTTYLLQKAATRYRTLREGTLQSCQFPDPVHDASGRLIHKPKKWADAERRFLARASAHESR